MRKRRRPARAWRSWPRGLKAPGRPSRPERPSSVSPRWTGAGLRTTSLSVLGASAVANLSPREVIGPFRDPARAAGQAAKRCSRGARPRLFSGLPVALTGLALAFGGRLGGNLLASYAGEDLGKLG